MSKFKVGEYATCVDAGVNWSIEKGQSYLVLGERNGMVKVEVDGAEQEYFLRRFEPIEKKPKYSTPNGKHKHHDVIVAWANGAVIETKSGGKTWGPCTWPLFYTDKMYRIKPEKSEALVAAEKQLADAEKAVQAAKKAVQDLQELKEGK